MSFSNSDVALSEGKTEHFSENITSPVSRPSSITMIVVPVSLSPFKIAVFTGVAPRYLGRSEK